MTEINLNEFFYDLPEKKIAQYPLKVRDNSKLLIYKDNCITSDHFRNIDNYLDEDSLLVFNDTRVIRARLLFRKKSGAAIEVFCLDPVDPPGYEKSFGSYEPVEWKCIIGNLKKWKSGTLSMKFLIKGDDFQLNADRICAEGEAWRIRFSWSGPATTFSEVIEAAGHIPLPPYITRKDETSDAERYQTIYSKTDGSVAAPTAGLHFTEDVFNKLRDKGIQTERITLHVGAGTFQPVRSEKISDHEMHHEYFFVTFQTLKKLISHQGRIIATGTTTVRTLESLYWLGVRIHNNPECDPHDLNVGQWEPYESETDLPLNTSLEAVLQLMKNNDLDFINVRTKIIIIPGYHFRVTGGMITNFHQPGSTLLLLIAAFTGINWKNIYKFALENDFRFLSYGDSSLLFNDEKNENFQK